MNYKYNKLTPFKWFVLENFPFIEADFDALTEWQLFCKLGKEMNKIINSVNLSGEQVENLTNAFNTLQDYVNNYFENLDVQDEINNKLNEMAEGGELTEIISEYLNTKTVLAFNTITEMKSSENLTNTSIVRTLGFRSYNDGGGAFYKIRDVQNTDIINEIDLFAITNDSNLVAELVIENEMNFECFGGIADNTTDNTHILARAMEICNHIIFGSGTYLFNSDIIKYNTNDVMTIEGNNTIIKGLQLWLNTEDGNTFYISNKSRLFNFIGIEFKNNNNDYAILCCQAINIERCRIVEYDKFLYTPNLYIDNIMIRDVNVISHSGTNYTFELLGLGDEHVFENIHIFESNSNLKLLKAQNKRGLKIKNCLNGSFLLVNSNTLFENCHFEYGEITTVNEYTPNLQKQSIITFLNCHFDYQYIFPIDEFCTFENCIIQVDAYKSSIKTGDILEYKKMKGINNYIKADETVNNVLCRSIIGLNMTNDDSELTYSGNKTISSKRVIANNGYWNSTKNTTVNYTIFGSSVDHSINGSNYSYSIYTASQEITNDTDCVIFVVDTIYKNCFIHCYREIDGTIEQAILPNKSKMLCDFGDNISGIKWEIVDSIPSDLSNNNGKSINNIMFASNSANLNGSGYIYKDNSDNIIKYKV